LNTLKTSQTTQAGEVKSTDVISKMPELLDADDIVAIGIAGRC